MDYTIWLSFAGDEGFRGVSVVDVTEADLADALIIIKAQFPHALPGAELVGAATAKAHREGCNPGGEVLAHPVDPSIPAPRNTLLSKDRLQELGLI